jgi:predicted  nucleic acid-binding Zn-ribbon protein
MPAIPHEQEIDRLIELKIKAWAVKLKLNDSFDNKLNRVTAEKKELADSVTQLSRHVSSIELKIDYLESFCGFNVDKDTIASLSSGDDFCISPEYKISTRLDNVEKCLGKMNQDVQRVERELERQQYNVFADTNTHANSSFPTRHLTQTQKSESILSSSRNFNDANDQWMNQYCSNGQVSKHQ